MYKSQSLGFRVRGNREKKQKGVGTRTKNAKIGSESHTIVNDEEIERTKG
jgi:hypothetical protein